MVRGCLDNQVSLALGQKEGQVVGLGEWPPKEGGVCLYSVLLTLQGGVALSPGLGVWGRWALCCRRSPRTRSGA